MPKSLGHISISLNPRVVICYHNSKVNSSVDLTKRPKKSNSERSLDKYFKGRGKGTWKYDSA